MSKEPEMSDSLREMLAVMDKPSLGKTLGFEYVEVSAERVVVSVPLGSHLHQPYGIVHGGTWCAVAEEVASVGGAVALGDAGHVVGVNNSTDFLRPGSTGTATATGTPIHVGRTQQLWRIEIVGDNGKLIALSQVRLANIPAS